MCHAAPLCTMPGCFTLQAFLKRFCAKCTRAYLWDTYSAYFEPQLLGTILLTLWTTLGSGLPWQASRPVGTSMARLRCPQAPLCRMGTASFKRALECHESWIMSILSNKVQSTLPKSKSHKSNNRLSRSPILVLFFIFYCFWPHILKSNFLFKSKLFLQSQWIQLLKAELTVICTGSYYLQSICVVDPKFWLKRVPSLQFEHQLVGG